MNNSINSKRTTKGNEIKEGLVGAFQSLLVALNRLRLPLPNLSFNVISKEQVVRLEEMFMKEEIFAAILGLNGDKALGPNDFPLAF